jgi:hypothetical protein
MTIRCQCGHRYPQARGERLARLVAEHETEHDWKGRCECGSAVSPRDPSSCVNADCSRWEGPHP